MRGRPTGFVGWLAVVTAVGAVVRLAWLSQVWNDPIGFEDAFFYHHQANLLAEGKGFISPFAYRTAGIATPGAEHPPLYSLYLALFSFAGATSIGWHQTATVLLGVGTVALIGLAGREALGERVGLAAAAIAAVYPHLWYQNAIVWAEASSQAAVALFIFVAFRYRRRPSTRNLVVLGVAAGLAALTRTELVLLLPFGVVPLAWMARPGARRTSARRPPARLASNDGDGSAPAGHRARATVDRRAQLSRAAVGGAAGMLVLLPWIALNLGRFDKTTTLSSNVGLTLASASCDTAWYGPLTGYWDFGCAQAAASSAPPGSDQSEVDAHARDLAVEYISEHRDRIPTVLGARLARTYGLWPPSDQVTIDELEGRPRGVAGAGVATWYLAVGLGIAGIAGLRRHGTTLVPLLAPIAVMTVGVLTAFGSVRYRATAEPAVVVLAAIGAVAILDRWRRPEETNPPAT